MAVLMVFLMFGLCWATHRVRTASAPKLPEYRPVFRGCLLMQDGGERIQDKEDKSEEGNS